MEEAAVSLLDEYVRDTGRCVMLDRVTKPDGRGGIIYSYEEGAEFDAAIYLENSLEQEKAEKQGVTGIYQVTVSRSTRLGYHDVFRRLKDGRTFRVTSKDEKQTPASSVLDMRSVRAEEYELSAGAG